MKVSPGTYFAVAITATVGIGAAAGIRAMAKAHAKNTAIIAARLEEIKEEARVARAIPPPAPLPMTPMPTDNPAPDCVRAAVLENMRRVGPGMADIGCEGRHFRCVATHVNGVVNFNCAEKNLDQPPGTMPPLKQQGAFNL